MPIYDYRCEECNFQIDLNRKVEDRDDLASVTMDHCPIYKEKMNKQNKEIDEGTRDTIESPMWMVYHPDNSTHLAGCKLKRVPTCGGFTI